MTDDEANRYHIEALVGGRTRWRERIEQVKILGVRWDKLPLKFRQAWWKTTDYGEHSPSPEFAPDLLSVEQAQLENDKREIVADTVRASEFLRQIRKPPCEQCLRPASPCRERCLRSFLTSENRAGMSADAIEAHRCRLAIHRHHPFTCKPSPLPHFFDDPNSNAPLSAEQANAVLSIWAMRGERRNVDEALERHCVPVRLLRDQSFTCDGCGELFKAGDVVLIPRPEAEGLVQIGDAVFVTTEP